MIGFMSGVVSCLPKNLSDERDVLMEEQLLKEDPLKKQKKIWVCVSVIMMALMMIASFAALHWVYIDYFHFKSNEKDSLQSLENLRGRYVEEERAAKKRLMDIEEHAKAAEKDALTRAAAAEIKSQKNIDDAEAKSKARIDALDKEYEDKRVEKEEYFKKISRENDEALETQKRHLADQIKNYRDAFSQKTNAYEAVLADLRSQEAELKGRIDQLPDLRNQFAAETNALQTARVERDATLKEVRDAQDELASWKEKIGEARAKRAEIEVNVKNLENERTKVQEKIVALNKEYESKCEERSAEFLALEKTHADAFVQTTNALARVIDGLRTQVDSLRKQRADMQSSIDQLPDVRDILRDETNLLASARQSAVKLRNEIHQAQDDLGAWKDKIGAAKGECSELQSKILALRQELKDLEQSVKEGKVELAKSGSEKKSLDEEARKVDEVLAGLRIELENATKKKTFISQELDQIERDKKNAEISRDTSLAEAKAAEVKRTTCEARLNCLNEDIKRLEEVLHMKKNAVAELTPTVEEKEAK